MIYFLIYTYAPVDQRWGRVLDESVEAMTWEQKSNVYKTLQNFTGAAMTLPEINNCEKF